jgi:hypothetical protein
MVNESLEARQIRLAKNQSLFRAVNERVEKISAQQPSDGPISFVCECAKPDCGNRIELEQGEYEAIRADPTHFFVLPDHVFPEAEIVIDDRDRYVVVEKIGAAGAVAEAIGTPSTD